jgi:hypothetical protein
MGKSGRLRVYSWVRWIVAAIALAVGTYQFVHLLDLGSKEVGAGKAFGPTYNAYVTPGQCGLRSGGCQASTTTYDYGVHIQVYSQHHTQVQYAHHQTELYSLVTSSSGSIPLQQVEVDKFTNAISRVQYDGRWLSVNGRQTTMGLTLWVIGSWGLAPVCIGWNVPGVRERLRGRASPSGRRRYPITRRRVSVRRSRRTKTPAPPPEHGERVPSGRA